MNLEEISYFGAIKGLNLIGSGDFTHPRWLKELREGLEEVDETGVYRLKDGRGRVFFLITTEVSTVFEYEGSVRKVHHVIFVPSLAAAEQVNDCLSPYGDLEADGRPTLNMTAAELVEALKEICEEAFIFPAHAWTPWFSLFGSNNGFNAVAECYQDKVYEIHALETGLSSDPPMNWRVSGLDKYALISNSDSHSAWPWRLGREANVLDMSELNYRSLIQAFEKKDVGVFKFTVETPPQYGKYHWTGHRLCDVSMPPSEAVKLGNKCPRCGRRMVKGVEQRVEELADRPAGFQPEGAVGYVTVIPLSEILAKVLNLGSPASRRVWSVYNALVSRFGSEFNVLLEADLRVVAEVAGPQVAKAIEDMRAGRLRIAPGYDGVYGRLLLGEESFNLNSSSLGCGKTGLKEGLWRYM